MSTDTINVTKRDGSVEPLDLDKIHKMVEEACNDLAGVSASQVEMNSGIQFYDGITTNEIQEILIRSASDLISLDAPNYQYVAARLLLFGLRKQVFDKKVWREGMPKLYDVVLYNATVLKVYDEEILDKYDDDEWTKLNGWINHSRDYLYAYAGLRQVVDKYLVQDRSTATIYETPQYMYMLIAMTLFAEYPKETRLSYVRKYYDAISKFKISLPTPIMGGLRTKLRQYASCVLVDVDDTKPSIGHSDVAVFDYVSQRAGIGLNMGRIRGVNSKINGGEVIHTGIIPFLKRSEATVKSCTQNGIRGGSATVHFPIWHQEIEDILVLKNNKGTQDNRVRGLDYSIQVSKLFYERFISGEDISLFSPHDVPGLLDAFGTPGFDKLYEAYEFDPDVPQKRVNCQSLVMDLLKERLETGRIYIMNIDHCNEHSSFKDKVWMSNLCQEITLPTKPIQDFYDEEGEIALCILSAVNVGRITDTTDLKELCDLAVRGLDELIEYQDYPVRAAEISTKNRRSLGIGFIGYAHFLARCDAKYWERGSWRMTHEMTESFQYYLLKASNELAKEKGACGYFDRTKYSEGILPIDTYKKDVDELVPLVELRHDWESLRESILEHGLRNSTLSAQMPSESSSVVSNATNGIEPPRGYLSVKKSKKGPIKQVVPQYATLKKQYSLLWDMPSNEGYIKNIAIIQKFFDQAISGNWSYNPEHYEDNQVPMSAIAEDFLNTYKYGWKTSYYLNTYDGKDDSDDRRTEEQKQLDDLLDEFGITNIHDPMDGDCDACKI